VAASAVAGSRCVGPVVRRPRPLSAWNVQSWWHRNVEPVWDRLPEVDDPVLIVDEAEGRLVPAPPVSAPRGPVLLVV